MIIHSVTTNKIQVINTLKYSLFVYIGIGSKTASDNNTQQKC